MTPRTPARRRADWPSRLDSYVHAMRDRPFEWGVLDCVSFAAGAVQAMTGWRPDLPAWVNQRSAMRQLRHLGGLRSAASSVLPELPNAALAQRGDVLLVAQPGRDLLAVCLGPQWCAPGRKGLHFGPTLQALAAWKVG